MTDEDFARGVLHRRAGAARPAEIGAAQAADQPAARPEVIAHFRRTGRGWQSRINSALRKAARLPAEKKRKA